MRTLLWTEQYWPFIGGLEIMASRFAAAMRQRGHEITVITGHGAVELPDVEEHEGVTIHRLPFYRALSEGDVPLLLETRARVSALKKSLRPEIVHVAMIGPSVFFHLQTAAAWPCPLLVTQQLSTQAGQEGGADTLLGRTLAAADWLVGCADSVVAELVALEPTLRGRASTIHNGVRPPAVAPAPRPLDPPVLLGLGRLVPEKAFERIIRALPLIRQEHPGTRLVFAGEGPERAMLERLAADLGVRRAVEFAGWVEPADVPVLINAATMLVMPSRTEALPLVAIEAALLERPVVANPVGGVAEIVIDGETGCHADASDRAALAAAVSGLLDDPAGMAELGARARRRAMQSFTWDAYMDGYETLYERLVDTAATRPLTARAS